MVGISEMVASETQKGPSLVSKQRKRVSLNDNKEMVSLLIRGHSFVLHISIKQNE